MKRLVDLLRAVMLTMALLLPFMVLAVMVWLSSGGPVFYWSDRIGAGNDVFRMPKFRTMRLDTPVLATHLLNDPALYLTPLGGFLRRSSLDELPQLWRILKGEMGFVGPRPALYNQTDVIALRTRHGLHDLKPGLTGWAQVNGLDELSIAEKVRLDVEYL